VSRRGKRPVEPALAEVFDAGGLLQRALPDYEDRPAQLAMAQAVHRAVEAGEILLAEAGTGTGKTLAYLVPALLSGRKTVIATGTKTLQDQLFLKDIPLLARVLPRRFSASLMKGRGNYLCRRNLRRSLEERHTRAERDLLRRIQTWSATSPRGERAELSFLPEPDPLWDELAAWSETCLGTNCEDYESCFLTRMRQEAAAADVVIVNHHLLLADAVLRDSGVFQVIPSFDVLILDEAHLLEDVATDFFGEEISNLRVERLLRDAQREWAAAPLEDRTVPAQLTVLAEAAARFFQALNIPEGTQRLRDAQLAGLHRTYGMELVEAQILLSDLIHAGARASEGLLACARRAREQAVILRGFFDPTPGHDQKQARAVVRWSERRGRAVFLRASPLDVSEDFRRSVLEAARAVILTSATLATGEGFDFLAGRLGIENPRTYQAPSPFDYATQAVLYVPSHLPSPQDAAFIDLAAEEIRAILELSRGRALVLFTSLAAMEATHRILEERVPFPLLVQGQAPRSQLLDRFREDVASVLLATRSFWQGVDVVGESLSCVIIHRLPFGFPGEPVLEARLEYIQQQGGDPFWGYQVPSAIITLRQGLGRLIRSGSDRGALCILDGRILTRRYGRAFLQSLPPCPLTTSREDLARFFAQ
jgi:ATP-dependent DNA helicase DinG